MAWRDGEDSSKVPARSQLALFSKHSWETLVSRTICRSSTLPRPGPGAEEEHTLALAVKWQKEKHCGWVCEKNQKKKRKLPHCDVWPRGDLQLNGFWFLDTAPSLPVSAPKPHRRKTSQLITETRLPRCFSFAAETHQQTRHPNNLFCFYESLGSNR